MAPGLIAQTRILWGLPSTARISVNPAIPDFETLYALKPGNFSTPFTPESEEMLTITPAVVYASCERLHGSTKMCRAGLPPEPGPMSLYPYQQMGEQQLFPRNLPIYPGVHR